MASIAYIFLSVTFVAFYLPVLGDSPYETAKQNLDKAILEAETARHNLALAKESHKNATALKKAASDRIETLSETSETAIGTKLLHEEMNATSYVLKAWEDIGKAKKALKDAENAKAAAEIILQELSTTQSTVQTVVSTTESTGNSSMAVRRISIANVILLISSISLLGGLRM